VPRLEVRPFDDSHLEGAAGLLSERHARHRASEPLLPGRFEDPAAARAELEAVWRRRDASGAAGLRGRKLVGYLFGAPRDEPAWGPNVWVELAGHGVDEAELIRDLYAAAAGVWVDQGRTRHHTLVPATDRELVDAWFRLGFGQQQAHGLRELPAHVAVAVPDGFEIRAPRADEVERLIDVDLVLPEHQRRSPVFSTVSLPTRDESRAEWLSTLSGDEEQILIGARNGRPVACWALVPIERGREYRGLLRPERTCYLGFAASLPEARGSGIGVALTDASFAWAAEEGFETMATDWRVTNLLASRFWPRRGFRTAFLRLYRSIP
jgi:ribosomal protein S18 acetylase RimI-like enzyme